MDLTKDVYLQIGEYLDNKGKIQLSMTSKEMNKLKFIFLYEDRVDVDRIVNLSYYDNFENIASSYISISRNFIMLLRKGRLPKNVKYHHYTSDVTHFFLEFDPNNTLIKCEPHSDVYFVEGVPFFVTHLTFVDLNQPIYDIPSTVTHLDFGDRFNRSIIGSIPSSVTHLRLGNNFNGNLCKKSIPTSVKYLVLGEKYRILIPTCIVFQLDSLTYGKPTL
uniref:Uncharacterized protein n=1 Tax=viral metagenome TaxID=1070528 RepID=A0A6C0C692_9ZZZZ